MLNINQRVAADEFALDDRHTGAVLGEGAGAVLAPEPHRR
jgi:hypothetical protein